MVTNDTSPVPEEPKTFNTAWDHPNANSQAKWQEVIHSPVWISSRCGAWLGRALCPLAGAWKTNEPSRSSATVCTGCILLHVGTAKYLTSTHITFHVLLLMVLHFIYSAKIINEETTFLYGDFEEEIYMECHQGISNVKKDNCTILNKCMHGLVQAAWQYYKEPVEILKNSGFIRGSIDPCLYVKMSAKGIV